MTYRREHDSMGDVLVPNHRYWGAQTQRSLENFPIGTEKMPTGIIRAFGYLKKAADALYDPSVFLVLHTSPFILCTQKRNAHMLGKSPKANSVPKAESKSSTAAITLARSNRRSERFSFLFLCFFFRVITAIPPLGVRPVIAVILPHSGPFYPLSRSRDATVRKKR